MLANLLGPQGRETPPGTFIMTGSITGPIEVAAGDNITVRHHDLGQRLHAIYLRQSTLRNLNAYRHDPHRCRP